MSAATSSRSSATSSRPASRCCATSGAPRCRRRRTTTPRSASLDALVGASATPSTRETLPQEAPRQRARRQGDRDRAAAPPGVRRQFEIPGMPGAISASSTSRTCSARPSAAAASSARSRSRTATRCCSPRKPTSCSTRTSSTREAVDLVENHGIVFIDEIDKIANRGQLGRRRPSREGVQRDLLPLIEGTTVSTKYGPVKTDHILFIASGAFHVAKPSDLLPELQGRLPIRVELKALTREDLIRILNDTDASLIKQYVALMGTEGVTLDFTARRDRGDRRRGGARSTRRSRTSAPAGCRP